MLGFGAIGQFALGQYKSSAPAAPQYFTEPKPGETWRFSAYAQLQVNDPNITDLTIALEFLNAAETVLGGATVSWYIGRFDLALCDTGDVVAPAGTVYTRVRIQAAVSTGGSRNFALKLAQPYLR